MEVQKKIKWTLQNFKIIYIFQVLIRLNYKLDTTEERISKLENRSQETKLQYREKRIYKNKP